MNAERERLRLAMREQFRPEYAGVADMVTDHALHPEGYVTWLAMQLDEATA